MAQGECSPARLCIFRVAHARDGREVESGLLCHIAQDHRTQGGLVAVNEELVLQLDDGTHRHRQRLAAHLHGLDEVLGGVHLFLNIEQRLFRLPAQVVLVCLIFLHRIDKRLRHLQFGHLAVVQRKGDGTVVLRIYDEVGGDLLQAPADGLAQRGTRPRVQLAQFVEEGCSLLVVQGERTLYLVPMFPGECLEIVIHDTGHQRLHTRVRSAVYLQQQTLLQVSGTDAGRVEGLQHGQRLLDLLHRGVDVMVDSQFLADGVERLPQQTVVFQRADQVFHDVALTVGHLQFDELAFQLVIERLGGTIDHLLTLLDKRRTVMIDRQVLIVAPDAIQSLVEGRLALLTLAAGLEVVGIVGAVATTLIVRIVWSVSTVIRGVSLQRRVVVHLGVDPVHKLGDRQLHQRGLKQLLMRERLSLLQLL